MTAIRQWTVDNNKDKTVDNKKIYQVLSLYDKIYNLLFKMVSDKNASIAHEQKRKFANYREMKESVKIVDGVIVDGYKIPVIQITFKGVVFTIKTDTNKYVVTIKSNRDIKGINSKFLFDKEKPALNFDGIPETYRSFHSYFENKSDFSFELSFDCYNLYVLLFLMLRRIYNFK